MADYKPQGKSKQGRKVVGAQEITYTGYDVHSNGMNEVGFPQGYQDHLSSPVITHTDGKVKPLYVSSTDEDFVTKTETTVEYIRVPMVTTQGNSSPSIIAPVGTTLVPAHNRAPKVQTDTGRPYKTGTLSNLYWWCKPNSNAIGGIYDSGLPAANTVTTTDGRAMPIPSKEAPPKGIPLTKPTNMVETDHFKNGTVIAAQPLGPQVHVLPPVVSQANFSLPTIDSRRAMPIPSEEAPPKGIPLSKPTNKVDTDHFKDGTVIVPRPLEPQVHVLPPVVSQAKISLPTIDSTEAKRRYGGVSTFPAEAYVPAIDSREAAWKYRGQML
ncbi:hypothetical protein FRX31_002728 [Thalictrum thalictroides]|uniref:Uncharacterized protein n=1 Tax=Thalictrum thalictroides TaxID=46969 RepID=A0A7J6XGG6_THATH|nr:hypothetical protein FRX31_002728 [Thalictrum thalictroides]